MPIQLLRSCWEPLVESPTTALESFMCLNLEACMSLPFTNFRGLNALRLYSFMTSFLMALSDMRSFPSFLARSRISLLKTMSFRSSRSSMVTKCVSSMNLSFRGILHGGLFCVDSGFLLIPNTLFIRHLRAKHMLLFCRGCVVAMPSVNIESTAFTITSVSASMISR